jgi:hypothetical protein
MPRCSMRAARDAPQPGLVLGHHQAQGPGDLVVLPALRDSRHLQPLRCRLAARRSRKRDPREAAHRETCEKEHVTPGQLTVHADRGASMRSLTVAQFLAGLSIMKRTAGRTSRTTTRHARDLRRGPSSKTLAAPTLRSSRFVRSPCEASKHTCRRWPSPRRYRQLKADCAWRPRHSKVPGSLRPCAT